MPSAGLVSLADIKAMLEACAPGARIESKLHRNWVYANGLIWRGLPLGPHGARKNPGIEKGHVKKMARYLGILDCAKKHLQI